MKFRKQVKYRKFKRKVYQSKFRPTREDLEVICKRGEELLDTPTDEFKEFRLWE